MSIIEESTVEKTAEELKQGAEAARPRKDEEMGKRQSKNIWLNPQEKTFYTCRAKVKKGDYTEYSELGEVSEPRYEMVERRVAARTSDNSIKDDVHVHFFRFLFTMAWKETRNLLNKRNVVNPHESRDK